MMDHVKQDNDGLDEVIVRLSLSDQIYERLKDEIITHKIGFGEKLVNRDLQKRFGVSSTPIRDAINHLYVDGLLDSITNGGAKVITFDLRFALEINHLILTFTRGAIRLIEETGSLPRLGKLLAPLVEDQVQIRTQDEYILLDQSFHETFFNCCGNRQLRQLYDKYVVLFEMLVRLTRMEPSNHPSRINEHNYIYERCMSDDVAGLYDAIDQHYRGAARWFTENASHLGLSE